MKNLGLFALIFLFFTACSSPDKSAVDSKETSDSSVTTTAEEAEVNASVIPIGDSNFLTLSADVETDPVETSDDAADDPAVWLHPESPSKSLVFGTNKDSGIGAYNLTGKEIAFHPVGKVNNIDIRYGFPLNNEKIDILAGSNRTDNSVSVFKVLPEGGLENILSAPIKPGMPEVYGFCLYKSLKSGSYYAFVVGKGGEVEQWELVPDGEKIRGERKRAWKLGSQAEGMVADDVQGNLFIAEENVGLWRFDPEPDAEPKADTVALIGVQTELKDDLEGVAIYAEPDGKGYLLVSSQGNNSYAVFERNAPYNYIGSFRITDSELVDGTSETDGIEVSSTLLGSSYPKGIFIAQDGTNTTPEGGVQNQNFKLVSWERIAMLFDPPLRMNADFSLRNFNEQTTDMTNKNDKKKP